MTKNCYYFVFKKNMLINGNIVTFMIVEFFLNLGGIILYKKL